ncbi:TadE-like protein [Pseudovibrio sp. Ad46]|uniref:TadE/TadG family type IV pilus assembly protein n=1 Tax=unclassified Pseudovibrio TaxID=2627060 RepID=UPI0007B1DCA3|nr:MULTISPECIES: TadE/TadG family type IV pilus assembly protein [unclassified Pseudovibrio]KZK93875.1 TadE-like protein [Pseudovibrio sp. Ad46]KZL00089.1 TadE-like protein [Pseudovibrio sp. Ad5]
MFYLLSCRRQKQKKGFQRQCWRYSFLSDSRGVTAIEFAIIAPVLFAVVLAIFELGLSMLVEVILDNAVAEAARQIRTGQVFIAAQDGEYNQTKFKNVILDNGAGLLKAAEDRIFINVESFENFNDIPGSEPLLEDGVIAMDQNWDPGRASDVVVVRVVCAWPLITSKMIEFFGQTDDGSRILVATEIFRNEPFS